MRVVQMSAFPNRRSNLVQNTPQPPPQQGLSHTENAFYKRNEGFNLREIISRFEKDDYILAGILIALIAEGCDDYILLAALGYLFVMGILPEKEH